MVSQGRDLPRIADQPALKVAGAHFGMELNGESRADRKRLVLALRRRCEALRADRQIEGIPMPMKNGNALLARALQLALPPRFRQLDRSPADLRRSLEDACAQGLGEDFALRGRLPEVDDPSGDACSAASSRRLSMGSLIAHRLPRARPA
jgi:hypothetical protein